jgi:hypothetical protein
MTINEFVKKIENGYDIMFDCLDRHFTILTWTEEGINIGEQYPKEQNAKVYKTAKELIDNFMIGEYRLADIVEYIVITDYT